MGFKNAVDREKDKRRFSGRFILTVFALLTIFAAACCFFGCESLRELQDDELVFISNGDGTCTLASAVAFYGKDVVIPEISPSGERVTAIGDNAFYGSEITGITIPEGICRIGERAFAKCKRIKSVNFPASVSEIGLYVLEGCVALEKITVSDGNPVYCAEGNCLIIKESKTLAAGCKSSVIPVDGSVEVIGEGAFYGCEELGAASVPEGVTAIGDWAFSGCVSMESVKLPDSLISFGKYAFNECNALTVITLPRGIETLSEGMLRKCVSLSVVRLPETLKVIGTAAFFGCESLFSVELPQNLTTISDRAFYGCSRLDKLDVGENVDHIGECIAAYCDKLRYIWVSSRNPVYKTVGQCVIERETKTAITGVRHSVIPDDGSVTSIADKAFMGVQGFWKLTIPASITSIGDRAYANCGSLYELTISDGVKSIGEEAFYGCSKIETVNILSRLEYVGPNAFGGCDKAKINYCGETVPDGWDPRWNPDGRPTAFGYVPPPPEEENK